MSERHTEQARSDYNMNNQYSATHEDAKASSGKGKGVGGSHSFWLPNCTGTLNVINYSNFATDISYGAGNADDNKARNESLARSLYNNETPYGNIDTSANRADGQFSLY